MQLYNCQTFVVFIQSEIHPWQLALMAAHLVSLLTLFSATPFFGARSRPSRRTLNYDIGSMLSTSTIERQRTQRRRVEGMMSYLMAILEDILERCVQVVERWDLQAGEQVLQSGMTSLQK
ncbi:uncharacterized protein LOC116255067 [Nymphaea colorata]|nr:uncharacterized protein LOC116254574 [Nymphaea colorata]XP_031486664.1 uncharacterized protein LOC116255067 [Nymphaea colorata]